MGSSWNEKPLGELISYISRGVTPKYVESADENAVIVLGQRCVRNSGLDISQSRFHDLSAKKVKDEKFVRMHDILITATGVGCAGRVSQVLDSLPYGTLTDSHVLTLRAKDIDPVYLGYFIKSKQYMLELMAEGSTGQTEMNKTRVQEEIVVTYPMDASVQKAIADTLRDFDEKIEINKQLNDYLRELIKVLFAHWFKDFAPFQSEDTYVTEIGDIPTSVKLVPLAELTKVITKGTTPTTLGFEYKKSGINFIKGESIGDDHSFDYGKFAHIDEEANAALKRSVIEDRDLLFTIAGTLGRFAMAEKEMIPA